MTSHTLLIITLDSLVASEGGSAGMGSFPAVRVLVYDGGGLWDQGNGILQKGREVLAGMWCSKQGTLAAAWSQQLTNLLNAFCRLQPACPHVCICLPPVGCMLQDPNTLKLTLPEGILVTSRVLRRSEQQMADDRFETSEFLQQVFDDGSIGKSHTMLSAARGVTAC